MPQTCQFSWQHTSTFQVFSSGFHSPNLAFCNATLYGITHNLCCAVYANTAARQCRPGTAIAIRWMPDTNRSLQSSNAYTCVVPWMKTHLGDNVDSPGVYNTLSTSLHLMDNYKRFTCLLKAHLRLWFVMTIFSVLCIFLLTFGKVGSGRILK